jgi:hypothetical protein
MYLFSPLENPQYYGIDSPRRHPDEIFRMLAYKRPSPGIYIISSHHVPWLRHVDPNWRSYPVADRIGHSLWVYRF